MTFAYVVLMILYIVMRQSTVSYVCYACKDVFQNSAVRNSVENQTCLNQLRVVCTRVSPHRVTSSCLNVMWGTYNCRTCRNAEILLRVRKEVYSLSDIDKYIPYVIMLSVIRHPLMILCFCLIQNDGQRDHTNVVPTTPPDTCNTMDLHTTPDLSIRLEVKYGNPMDISEWRFIASHGCGLYKYDLVDHEYECMRIVSWEMLMHVSELSIRLYRPNVNDYALKYLRHYIPTCAYLQSCCFNAMYVSRPHTEIVGAYILSTDYLLCILIYIARTETNMKCAERSHTETVEIRALCYFLFICRLKFLILNCDYVLQDQNPVRCEAETNRTDRGRAADSHVMLQGTTGLWYWVTNPGVLICHWGSAGLFDHSPGCHWHAVHSGELCVTYTTETLITVIGIFIIKDCAVNRKCLLRKHTYVTMYNRNRMYFETLINFTKAGSTQSPMWLLQIYHRLVSDGLVLNDIIDLYVICLISMLLQYSMGMASLDMYALAMMTYLWNQTSEHQLPSRPDPTYSQRLRLQSHKHHSCETLAFVTMATKVPSCSLSGTTRHEQRWRHGIDINGTVKFNPVGAVMRKMKRSSQTFTVLNMTANSTACYSVNICIYIMCKSGRMLSNPYGIIRVMVIFVFKIVHVTENMLLYGMCVSLFKTKTCKVQNHN